jgi:hypothetical protein
MLAVIELKKYGATCNCTPWCAIGFGTFADGETPVYYSGGAKGF